MEVFSSGYWPASRRDDLESRVFESAWRARLCETAPNHCMPVHASRMTAVMAGIIVFEGGLRFSWARGFKV